MGFDRALSKVAINERDDGWELGTVSAASRFAAWSCIGSRGRVEPGRVGVMNSESAHHQAVRHRDGGTWLVECTGRILVVCPTCGGRASVVPRPGVATPKHCSELLFLPRRLLCAGCGALADWRAEERAGGLVGAVPRGTEDPFFRRPLWLQARCAGQVRWAYDEEHVDAFAAYVGAHLRARRASPTRSTVARLPAWMKAADRRREVLAGLATLRALA